MDDKDTYPLTSDKLRPGKVYEDSRGNWWKIKGTDKEYEWVIVPKGLIGDEVPPSPYNKQDVCYRELDENELASVQPSKKGR